LLYINNPRTDPYFNHALEEFFLKETGGDCFILWRNAPCILLGRNQNAYAEINMEYVKANSLPVVRRISGGGAVFNDLGNINFGFIESGAGDLPGSFERFTAPVIKALKKLGVHSELSGRNDITVGGKKISGNAQARYKNRVLHHGTLLFSASMADLSQALNVSPLKLEGKGVRSVSARVTNISGHLERPMSVTQFKNYLMDEALKSDPGACAYMLPPEEERRINRLAAEKYGTREWNFGTQAEYHFSNIKKFPGGIVEVNLSVLGGMIGGARIFGDFFGREDIAVVENALIGAEYSKDSAAARLGEIDVEASMTDISAGDLLSVLFP
jgi:lipoate-protein ligase A